MSKGLPSVYTPEEYRKRMNREVDETFGEGVRNVYTQRPYDVNESPEARDYERRFKLMSPGMKYKFNKSKRGMNPKATEFAPGRGGKKSKHMRKKSMTKKRKHRRMTKRNTKKHRRMTKRHRRK